MKPHLIWLMASSVDGRTLRSRWRPKGPGADLFERVHDGTARRRLARRPRHRPGIRQGQAVSRLDERDISVRALVRATRKACGVVLDAHGKIGWGRSDIGGDPIVVLSETVSNAHLAG
jgi:hypothetical protein